MEDVQMKLPEVSWDITEELTGTWNSSVMCELKPLPHWTVPAQAVQVFHSEESRHSGEASRYSIESSESLVMVGVSGGEVQTSGFGPEREEESPAAGRALGDANDEYEQDSNISRDWDVEFSENAQVMRRSNSCRWDKRNPSKERVELEEGELHHCDEDTFRKSVDHMMSGPDSTMFQNALQFELASEDVLRATMAYTPLNRLGKLIRKHKQGFARQQSPPDGEEEDAEEVDKDSEPESPRSPVSPMGTRNDDRKWESQGSEVSQPVSPQSPNFMSLGRRGSVSSNSTCSTMSQSSIASTLSHYVQYWQGDGFDPYTKSFQTAIIDDFWSHSWRAPGVSKVLTLLLYYNGLPGAIIGSILAGVMCGFVGEGILPGPPDVYPIWTLDCASLAFFLTLVSWQARRRVFLDKVCIHQTDLGLKKKGVESIGGFLKHSSAVLMLWDPSYGKRLWCVFEVAAFTKIHEQDGQSAAPIIVRPVSQGPLILVFMGVLIVGLNAYHWLTTRVDDSAGIHSQWTTVIPAYCLLFLSVAFLICMFDNYNRNMKRFFRQLRHFRVKKSECYCCTVNHMDPMTGKELLCDRAIVYTCVERWFGTYERFETFVKMPLYERFERQLGRMYLPYRAIVVGSLPLAWAVLGMAAADLRERWRVLKAVTWSVRALTCWLAMAPLVVAIWILLISQVQCLKAKIPCNRARPRTRATAFAAQVACLGILPPVICYGAVLAVDEFIPDWGDFVLSLIFGLPTAVVYRRRK